MARADIAELYRELLDSAFTFVPRGEHHLKDVYAMVKHQYSHLCDDHFLCVENCSHGHRQPEWKHATRKALWSQKTDSVHISAGHARGYWNFS